MDQHEDKKTNIQKQAMRWFDWSVFLVPILLFVGLGLESAFGNAEIPHRDFRAVAHWFDPVFFQYNLIMALLAVLVVPSLALSYIQTMANRKARRLHHEVPPERWGEIRRGMQRRASFSTYRGSVWMTTTIVLLGTCILLLFKPAFSAGETGANFGLGTNMLTIGPFAELYKTDPPAYYSHLIHNLTAFQFGFLGAYIYFIGAVVRAYFTLDLTSHTFVDGAIRMIAASILALVLSFAFDIFTFNTNPNPAPAHSGSTSTSNNFANSDATAASPGDTKSPEPNAADSETPTSLSLLPIVAFFFGFYPKRASLAIERIAIQAMKSIVSDESYRALPLSMLAGMSYSHELRLEREGFDNIENLSNADPADLAMRTSFSYKQLKQWIDQGWLAVHLREDYPEFVRRTGISSGEELSGFLCPPKSAQLEGIEQLVAALTTDTALASSWKVRLTALKLLLEANKAPFQNVDVVRLGEQKTD